MIKFLGGNQLTLLQNGVEFFPALEAAIDQAQHQVFLESYIYAHDDAGQRIAGALMRAVQRGVATHLVIDGYGAQDYPFTAREALRKAGVKVLVYRPQISPWRFPRQHRVQLADIGIGDAEVGIEDDHAKLSLTQGTASSGPRRYTRDGALSPAVE